MWNIFRSGSFLEHLGEPKENEFLSYNQALRQKYLDNTLIPVNVIDIQRRNLKCVGRYYRILHAILIKLTYLLLLRLELSTPPIYFRYHLESPISSAYFTGTIKAYFCYRYKLL